MSYDATVLADSLSPDGVRLTTLKVTFPRFILAEVNTHRMLSRNSASSRAIPTEKMIERVRENPFIPETFNKRVKGMGVGEALDEGDMQKARGRWLLASKDAADSAAFLSSLDVDKSRANRLLEPFLWHTAILSGTEWDNFFALRDHPAAQPEFQITAQAMKAAMAESRSVELAYGEWHLPLVDMISDISRDDLDDETGSPDWDRLKLISAGRCARVSYDRDDYETQEQSIKRAQMLMGNGHFSPFEHVATPSWREDILGSIPMIANFRGWIQMRREVPNESRFDLAMAEESVLATVLHLHRHSEFSRLDGIGYSQAIRRSRRRAWAVRTGPD